MERGNDTVEELVGVPHRARHASRPAKSPVALLRLERAEYAVPDRENRAVVLAQRAKVAGVMDAMQRGGVEYKFDGGPRREELGAVWRVGCNWGRGGEGGGCSPGRT